LGRVWVADLILAALIPTIGLSGISALISHLWPSDSYEHQYYLWVDPVGQTLLAVPFLIASAWSYIRPGHALRAQLVPAVSLSIVVAVVLYRFSDLPSP
jgi:hypothetical protein